MLTLDWSKFELKVDGVVGISPCLALALYLERVDETGIIDFFERSREALGGLLAFSSTGSSRRSKVTARSMAAVSSWEGKMSRTQAGLYIEFNSLKEGAGPASLLLFVSPPAYASNDPKIAAKGRREILEATYAKHGGVNVFLSARLYVSFPTNHDLAKKPAQMRSWVQSLQLVREGRFVSGQCGFALNLDQVSAGRVGAIIQERSHVFGRQYPAFDYDSTPDIMQILLHYNGRSGNILHKVLRASWLTLLSGNCVDQIGGMTKLQANLGEGPAILYSLANGAALLEAGPQPEIGDLSQRDLFSGYRQVARAIRPVRVEKLERTPTGSFEDYAQEWLEYFDQEPA